MIQMTREEAEASARRQDELQVVGRDLLGIIKKHEAVLEVLLIKYTSTGNLLRAFQISEHLKEAKAAISQAEAKL